MHTMHMIRMQLSSRRSGMSSSFCVVVVRSLVWVCGICCGHACAVPLEGCPGPSGSARTLTVHHTSMFETSPVARPKEKTND